METPVEIIKNSVKEYFMMSMSTIVTVTRELVVNYSALDFRHPSQSELKEKTLVSFCLERKVKA